MVCGTQNILKMLKMLFLTVLCATDRGLGDT